MDADKLINYSELSRLVTGDRTQIQKNRMPKKYTKMVIGLRTLVENWIKEEQTNFKTKKL